MADRQLKVFHAVAKHLSFTKAAETLFMTQPAVTSQIKQLEERLDVRLFDRAPGRISLTDAGAMMFDYAGRILALSAELDTRIREMGGQIAGPLLIGASTTIADFVLPQVLGEFKSHYPGVLPRLLVGNSEAVQNQVAERSLDIGFIEGDSHLPSLINEVCCDDELQVVCAPSHPLAQERSATPSSLMKHAYISREPGSGTREVINHYLMNVGVSPDSLQLVMEVGSPEALKGLVAAGLGFAIVSRATLALETRLGRLLQIPLSPPLTRSFSVIYPNERFHSKLLRSFVDFAKQRLPEIHRAG
jgi:DNA-binding transcriptional LysR family regulator